MKAYVKPELFYERYELSKHIADCALEPQSADVDSCHVEADPKFPQLAGFLGMKLFASLESCETEFSGYCYTNGNAGFNLFHS